MEKYTYMGVYVGGKFGDLTHGKEYNVEQQDGFFIIHDGSNQLTANDIELELNFRKVMHPTETLYQGVVIKKTTDIGKFGGIETYSLETAPAEIQVLDSGYYDFNGKVFQIDRKERNKSASIGFKISEDHPIRKAIMDYFSSLPDEENEEDDYIPSCSRCGDGGCPSCRPSWFL